MRQTKDYSKSPAPAFDAVEDLKFYFGSDWPKYRDLPSQVPNAYSFEIHAYMVGVSGFPVKAWWEHVKGQDTFHTSYNTALAAACDKAYDEGFFRTRDKKYVYIDERLEQVYQQGSQDGLVR